APTVPRRTYGPGRAHSCSAAGVPHPRAYQERWATRAPSDSNSATEAALSASTSARKDRTPRPAAVARAARTIARPAPRRRSAGCVTRFVTTAQRLTSARRQAATGERSEERRGGKGGEGAW